MIRGLPASVPARGLDPWRRPKGSWALGTRMPGLVAQLVERRCSNPEVVGSNPAGIKDFSFILVLISNFLLLRPVVGGKLWRAVLLTSWRSYIHTLHHKLLSS